MVTSSLRAAGAAALATLTLTSCGVDFDAYEKEIGEQASKTYDVEIKYAGQVYDRDVSGAYYSVNGYRVACSAEGEGDTFVMTCAKPGDDDGARVEPDKLLEIL